MFFVGATGQLLTLVLTVCLPFVFFLSGNKKVELDENSQFVEIQHNKISFDVSDSESVDFVDFVCEEPNPSGVILTADPLLKIPLLSFPLKTHSFSLDSSGNKAPPSGISFSC